MAEHPLNLYVKSLDTVGQKTNQAKSRRMGGELSGAKLAALLRYPDEAFAIATLDGWLAAFQRHGLHGYDPHDFLYWEQRLGNWGAMYPAEQDIAVDEVSPFNNRLILTTMLSAETHRRTASAY